MLASIVALATTLVPPLGGWLSDALRRRGGSRRALVGVGVVIDVGALAALAYVHTLMWFAVLLVVATLGANVALSAYQVLLPESVPRRKWGVASGVRGAATLVGSVVGFAIAGSVPNPSLTFMVTAIIMAAGGLSLLAIGDGTYDDEEHAHVRDWHDFFVVFVARALVFFGLTMLQTFVLFFVRDVQQVGNASAGTALYAFSTIGGALVRASIWACSPIACLARSSRRSLGLMALATIGFALAPELAWMLPFAVIFGIGFGGVMSTGWALAMDSIPKMRDIGRDLGLWGVATSLPNIAAPLVGGWLIGLFGGTRSGYQAVFGLSGFSFALAALSVLRVGRRPLSSLWAVPLRFGAVTSNYVWDRIAYRVRTWGQLPRRRGTTLIVANHQHDFESPAIVSTARCRAVGVIRYLPPVRAACTNRDFSPTGCRGCAFRCAASMPASSSWRWACSHSKTNWGRARLPPSPGPCSDVTVPFCSGEIFDERVASRFPADAKSSDLWRREFFERARAVVKVSTVREPYRREILDETREYVEQDLARMEDVVRRGGTFYLPPKGSTRSTATSARCAGSSNDWRRWQRSTSPASATIHSFQSGSLRSIVSCGSATRR